MARCAEVTVWGFYLEDATESDETVTCPPDCCDRWVTDQPAVGLHGAFAVRRVHNVMSDTYRLLNCKMADRFWLSCGSVITTRVEPQVNACVIFSLFEDTSTPHHDLSISLGR
jgi:hypothetical protein